MRIVWHCEDRAGPSMAGPAIRALELSSRLAAQHRVTLLCPGAESIPEALRGALEVREHRAGQSLLPRLAELRADALVAQGFGFPLRDLAALPPSLRLILDLYDPVQLELLMRAGEAPAAEERLHLLAVRARLLWLLARADQILCASERQRAFWLGWLGAAARLSPSALARDPSARELLAVVPFGIDDEPCVADENARGAKLLAEASGGEPAILWWGGLWDWMDPLTAVRAMARLRAEGARATLVLPAGNRPGADAMAMSSRAEEEARALGLWGRGVSRLPEWIPYAERGPLLAAARVAVSCHHPSLEAELAFRTRLLDCVWAALPAVATRGDELSARAEREGWCINISPKSEIDLAAALKRSLEPREGQRARAAARAASGGYRWSLGAQTLLELLEKPAPPRPPLALSLLPELRDAPLGDLAQAALRKLWKRARRP